MGLVKQYKHSWERRGKYKIHHFLDEFRLTYFLSVLSWNGWCSIAFCKLLPYNKALFGN